MGRINVSGGKQQPLVSGVQIYTTPGAHTFTVPESVYKIMVMAIGSGGGGSTPWTSSSVDAGSGGGGGASICLQMEVVPGQEIPLTIGSGGAASAAAWDAPGFDGTDTIFNGYIAPAGKGSPRFNSRGLGGTSVEVTGGDIWAVFDGGNGGEGENSNRAGAGGSSPSWLKTADASTSAPQNAGLPFGTFNGGGQGLAGVETTSGGQATNGAGGRGRGQDAASNTVSEKGGHGYCEIRW